MITDIIFLLDPLQKELDKQVKEAEFKQETIERKRKRKEKVDEDNAYLSDGNELFVAASDLARKARGFEGRAEIETINLIDDLEDD